MSESMLRIAARRVPGRWHQGSIDDGRGNLCGIGHLLEVFSLRRRSVRDREDLTTMQVALDIAAMDKFPERAAAGWEPGFATFNDHPLTSERDVVMVMELAADRWEVEHG